MRELSASAILSGTGGGVMDAGTMGAFIASVRKERGMTQAELAAKLYVSDKTVSKWERGGSLR